MKSSVSPQISSGGERREVEAYFVLLERPNMTNPPEDKVQEPIESAFSILSEITSSGRDVAMQISVFPDEKTVRCLMVEISHGF